GNLKLTDSAGNVMIYYGTDNANAALRGKPLQFIDAGGNVTDFSWSSNLGAQTAQLDTIQRKLGNSSTVLEQLSYTYNGAGLLSDVLMKRRNDFLTTPALQDVRKVHYDYYVGTSLMALATIQNPDNTVVEHKHYRYDQYNNNGRLTIVLEGASYERA